VGTKTAATSTTNYSGGMGEWGKGINGQGEGKSVVELLENVAPKRRNTRNPRYRKQRNEAGPRDSPTGPWTCLGLLSLLADRLMTRQGRLGERGKWESGRGIDFGHELYCHDAYPHPI
jgi:hypothetical protein